MGSFAQALTNLAAVPVPGVTSYPLASAPAHLSGAQLPALVILPELSREAQGLEPNRFSAGDGRLTLQVVHALLLAPVTAGFGARAAYPTLASLTDTYAAAMATDPTLGGALSAPLQASVRLGVLRHGDVDYHAAVFTHTWEMQL